MIIRRPSQISSPPLFYELLDFVPQSSVYIKLEGLNIASSIKLTTALGLIEALERNKKIGPNTILVESSSGNLGLALSVVCKERGYRFICITDPNILPENEKWIQLYGSKVIKITERDENGGYLASRIKFINEMISTDSNCIWLNQYANMENPNAHYEKTGKEILSEFPKVDFLFIGAGTTGTLMGCARLFKHLSPQTKIIGIDSIGSVTFGAVSKKRFVPGLGTSRRPEIADQSILDGIVYVDELDGIRTCQNLLNKHGLLLGGSSGSVMHGIHLYSYKIPSNSTVVTLSPDFGYKYVDNVYDEQWIQQRFL